MVIMVSPYGEDRGASCWCDDHDPCDILILAAIKFNYSSVPGIHGALVNCK